MTMAALAPTPGRRRCILRRPREALRERRLIAFDGDEVAVALGSNLGHRFFWQGSASRVNTERSIRSVPINACTTSISLGLSLSSLPTPQIS
jgi:hypothetical protein